MARQHGNISSGALGHWYALATAADTAAAHAAAATAAAAAATTQQRHVRATATGHQRL